MPLLLKGAIVILVIGVLLGVGVIYVECIREISRRNKGPKARV